MTTQQAVKKYIHNSDTVFIGGFGHAIAFAIAHEIVRQKKHSLHLVKTGADIVFDLLGPCWRTYKQFQRVSSPSKT